MVIKMTLTTNKYHLYILSIFCLKGDYTNKLNPSKTVLKYIDSHLDELNEYLVYLNNYAKDFNEETTICEKLYRIKYDLIDRPTCVVCGNYVKFLSYAHGYSKHCCKKCSCDDEHNKLTFKLSIYKNFINRHPEELLDFTKINDETDLFILNTFCLSTGTFDGNKILNSAWAKKHENYVNYLLNRFNCPNDSIQENLYRLKYNLQEKPKCIVCGKDVKFHSFAFGYLKTCSNSCKTLNEETKAKYNKTCLERYGCEWALQNKDIRNKCVETYKRHIKENFF